jgi:hypothetical protein
VISSLSARSLLEALVSIAVIGTFSIWLSAIALRRRLRLGG